MEKKNLFKLLFAIVAKTTTARTRAFCASEALDKHPLSLSLSLQIGRSRPFVAFFPPTSEPLFRLCQPPKISARHRQNFRTSGKIFPHVGKFLSARHPENFRTSGNFAAHVRKFFRPENE